MVTYYCDNTDVALACQMVDKAGAGRYVFTDPPTSNGAISLTEVTKLISWACDRIDEKTQQAWRINTVSNEYRDCDGYKKVPGSIWWACKIKLKHKNIAQFSSVAGDKIEYANGNVFTDLLATGTEGVELGTGTFFVDYQRGFVYIHQFFLPSPNKFRITYRYGNSTIPGDITEGCALLVASKILGSDFYSRNIPGNPMSETALSFASTAYSWAWEKINQYVRWNVH